MNWYKKASLEKLYHATYLGLEDEIKKRGLLICTKHRNYNWCEKGIYLASNSSLAESFVETSENENIPEEWFNNIIVLEVNTLYLDKVLLEKDPYWNIEGQEGSEKLLSFVYREDIPPEALKRIK